MPEAEQRKTDKNIARRNRILDAAAGLIAHYGYDKTSMDDIAREAHVSKGAIYLHFKSKDALIDALLIREGERITEGMFNGIEADPRGLSLFTMYKHMLTSTFGNPLMRRLYTRDRHVLAAFAARARTSQLAQQGMAFGADFVRGFQQAGLLRKDISPEVIAYTLLIIRFGLFAIEDYIPTDQAPPLDDIGDAIAVMLDSGFAAHGSPADQAAGRQALINLIEFGRATLRQMREQPDDPAKGKGENS